MADAIALEYRALIVEAEEVGSTGEASRRTLGRLRRELRAIQARDFSPAGS